MVVYGFVKPPLSLVAFLPKGIAEFFLYLLYYHLRRGHLRRCYLLLQVCELLLHRFMSVGKLLKKVSYRFCHRCNDSIRINRHKKMLVSLSSTRMKTRAYTCTFLYFPLTCEHVSNLAFHKEIIFCLIHYIQPSENTYFL